jgi:hypothetical protein
MLIRCLIFCYRELIRYFLRVLLSFYWRYYLVTDTYLSLLYKLWLSKFLIVNFRFRWHWLNLIYLGLQPILWFFLCTRRVISISSLLIYRRGIFFNISIGRNLLFILSGIIFAVYYLWVSLNLFWLVLLLKIRSFWILVSL